jgi:hypothetical protein
MIAYELVMLKDQGIYFKKLGFYRKEWRSYSNFFTKK